MSATIHIPCDAAAARSIDPKFVAPEPFAETDVPMERLVRLKRWWRNGGDLRMAFNPVSYIAGIGTVGVAVVVGFGGGLLLTNSAYKSEPPNRLERVAASTPLASASPTQAAITPDVTAAPAPTPEPGPAASPQQVTQPPAAKTAQAANQQPAVANDPPPSVSESMAKPQDQENDARRIAERKQAAHRKWAERKRRQQQLEAATVEVRRVDRDDDSREVEQRDVVEMPRSLFFGR
jgi:type IV secretory pathway VirB10-like protein